MFLKVEFFATYLKLVQRWQRVQSWLFKYSFTGNCITTTTSGDRTRQIPLLGLTWGRNKQAFYEVGGIDHDKISSSSKFLFLWSRNYKKHHIIVNDLTNIPLDTCVDLVELCIVSLYCPCASTSCMDPGDFKPVLLVSFYL